jgi:hypothetical protein
MTTRVVCPITPAKRLADEQRKHETEEKAISEMEQVATTMEQNSKNQISCSLGYRLVACQLAGNCIVVVIIIILAHIQEEHHQSDARNRPSRSTRTEGVTIILR